MSLRELLEASIPTEACYRAPKALRPLDEPEPDTTRPVHPSTYRAPEMTKLAIRGVGEMGIASTADVCAWLATCAEAKYSGDMTHRRVTRLLERAERKGLVRRLITTGAWALAEKR